MWTGLYVWFLYIGHFQLNCHYREAKEINYAPLIYTLSGSIIGGLFVLAGIFLQHKLEKRKGVKQYPSQIIYDKYFEFSNSLNPILHDINNFITSIDVWLSEKDVFLIDNDSVKKNIEDASKNTHCLVEFWDLVDKYSLFLHSKLYDEAQELYFNCIALSDEPSLIKCNLCIHILFSFQNNIRKLLGIDALSEEFFRVFEKQKKEINGA